MQPPTYVVESTPLFSALHMRSTDMVMRHYIPDSHLVLGPTGEALRAGVQRSQCFLGCLLELLCLRGGICLELGCGTAPILKASLRTGRVCASIDVDESIISSYVQPLLHSSLHSRRDDVMDLGGEDDVDVNAGANPFDD